MNGQNYLTQTIKLFKNYKSQGEKAIEQLDPEQLFYTKDTNQVNSIAMIINHLYGNMLSRWTDFLTSDGEKAWRNRDNEFLPPTAEYQEIMHKWEEGWQCLFTALESLHPGQLDQIVYIRSEGHTVIEAIQRQLTHYALHVGQIIFCAKQLKKGPWNSLSIPLGDSAKYNATKMTPSQETETGNEGETN